MEKYSPRSFCTGVPDRTMPSSVLARCHPCMKCRLTDSPACSQRLEHLGGLVVFRLESVTFIAYDQINGWVTRSELLAGIFSSAE